VPVALADQVKEPMIVEQPMFDLAGTGGHPNGHAT
jgi:hypothetical protein